MAIRATVLLRTLHQAGTGTYAIGCDFQIHDATYDGAPSLVVGPFDATSTALSINQAILNAIKARIQAEGYAFNLLDTIEVLNLNKLSIV